jgi:hypothetical protein
MIISGPQDVIQEIYREGFSLDKIVPCPPDLKGLEKIFPVPASDVDKRREMKEKYGVETQFDWQVSKWGTKWDINVGSIQMEKNHDGTHEIIVQFDSAWSPPVPAFEVFYNKYKDRGISLWWEYFEGGARFLGLVTGVDGIFHDDYREYTSGKELSAIVQELEHSLAESEVEYLLESEESDSEDSEDSN